MMDSNARSVEALFPNMSYMLQYYHMNWIDDPNYAPNGLLHPDHVLNEFIKLERPATVTAASEELKRFLETPRTEDELSVLLYGLYVNIRPAFRGLTTRQWLEHLLQLLSDR